VAGSCEYGDETSGSGATDLVKYNRNTAKNPLAETNARELFLFED
jgi:hypothetical protein